MHELSIAMGIVDAAMEESQRRGVQVSAVHLRLGALSGVRMPAVAEWCERERVICARYAAVQIDRRLQANLALVAALRSC